MRKITPMLETHDLQATLTFYTEVLGFEVETLWPDDGPTFCILDHGPVGVSFYLDPKDGEGAPALTGQLYIDVDDVMALFVRVRGHAEVLWGPEVYHYGRREFAVRDPNGYVLSFSEPTRDPPDDPHDPDARR